MPAAIHVWAPGIRQGSGGIQAFSRAYVRAIADGFPGHRVTVLVKNDDIDQDDPLRSLPNLSFHVCSSSRGPLRMLAFAAKGIWLGLRERPVCVVSTHLHFLPVMSLVRLLTGARILSVLHGIDLWYLQGWLRRRALRHADHLFAVSGFTRSVAINDFSLRPEQVSVVPNTFDEQSFQPGPKPDYLLRRHELSADQPVLLTIGRLSPGDRLKGHLQVLVALARLAPRHPRARYVIGGFGPDLPYLKEAVAGLGLQDRVIFAGRIATDELADYYRLADVFVMPGLKEGFGIVFLEAMASGKPVVAGNRDGSVDALDNGRLSILVDPHNAAELEKNLVGLIEGNHPHPLAQNPEALCAAVSAQFGFQRVSGLMVSSLRPWVFGEQPATDEPPLADSAASSPGASPAFRVVVVTEFTSPYQIELFNAIALSGSCLLEVVYMSDHDTTRHWQRPSIAHVNWIVSEGKSIQWEARKSIQDADLVVFNTYLFRFSLRALWLRAGLGKPWVFWGERPGSLQTGSLGRLMRNVLLRPLHQCSAPIWGMGKFGVEGYQREYGPDRTYRNFAYASDLERFYSLAERPATMRVFVYSGSLTRRKGCDLLATAFASVAARFPQARLVIVGRGPLEIEMRQTLSNCATQVDWLGFQSWEDIPAAMKLGSVLCLPSRYDGWGLALIEGLAAGMPGIGTDQTGSALELIADNKAGWLVPAGDAAALENAMEQALRLDDAAFASMQKAARNAASTYGLDVAAPRFLELCREALSNWHCIKTEISA